MMRLKDIRKEESLREQSGKIFRMISYARSAEQVRKSSATLTDSQDSTTGLPQRMLQTAAWISGPPEEISGGFPM